jgi:hypothetical protein
MRKRAEKRAAKYQKQKERSEAAAESEREKHEDPQGRWDFNNRTRQWGKK